jgi:hypothetical protein
LKYLFLVFLATVLLGFAEAPNSGIFIVKKATKKNPCEQELKMLVGGKKVCVLKKPIISVEELEYVTDILYDPVLKCNHVNLGLSQGSINTLNQTVTSIPEAEFALVVNDDVIGTFTIREKLVERYLRIGTDLDLKNLEMVRDALKKVQY